MKNLIKSIIIAFLISLPIFAAEETKQQTPSTKDAFMSLVLEKAKSYSDKAESAISKGVDVVLEQAPIIVKEYLEWNFFKAAVNAVLFCLLILIGLIFFFLFISGKIVIDGFGEYVIGFFCFVVAVILIALPLRESVMEMIKIKVAPRVYLIESTYDYVKNRK
jgi:hypothetical protein